MPWHQYCREINQKLILLVIFVLKLPVPNYHLINKSFRCYFFTHEKKIWQWKRVFTLQLKKWLSFGIKRGFQPEEEITVTNYCRNCIMNSGTYKKMRQVLKLKPRNRWKNNLNPNWTIYSILLIMTHLVLRRMKRANNFWYFSGKEGLDHWVVLIENLRKKKNWSGSKLLKLKTKERDRKMQ